LRDIEAQAAKAPLREVIADVRRRRGTRPELSAAFERHQRVRRPLANIVRAGEATGRVDKALDDLRAAARVAGSHARARARRRA